MEKVLVQVDQRFPNGWNASQRGQLQKFSRELLDKYGCSAWPQLNKDAFVRLIGVFLLGDQPQTASVPEALVSHWMTLDKVPKMRLFGQAVRYLLSPQGPFYGHSQRQQQVSEATGLRGGLYI